MTSHARRNVTDLFVIWNRKSPTLFRSSGFCSNVKILNHSRGFYATGLLIDPTYCILFHFAR
jgi:hypothetical protein